MTDCLDANLSAWQELKQECLRYNAQLMVVSKGQPPEKIIPFLEAGHHLFGENRVQEAEKKWLQLRALYPKSKVHLIGPLQTNKVRNALGLFDCIQSLDRPSLAYCLCHEMKRTAITVPLMIQVKLGNEPKKSGVLPEEADNFIKYCKEDLKLPIIGVMAIPPLAQNPMPFFKQLNEIANHHNLTLKSMGMSADYKAALQAGSTMVRIGSALFND